MGEPETAIRVEDLGKRYAIGHAAERGQSTLRDTLVGSVKALSQRLLGHRPKADPTREEFWALKDVTFEVMRGEAVGVIGRNGAGKSTLLKVLSRITEPTSGRVEIDGRVASLLEVGTGFHPELTGRENIYLNGAILGMTRAEIRQKFDEIVAFAEIEKFLETPVKRYSSGMYMRLAFAVAAHLESEILIVDEVLAVGDAAFQKKCLGKMGEVSRGGRTILFVSHNMTAVQAICDRVVHIKAGQVSFIGATKVGVSAYLQGEAGDGPSVAERAWPDDDRAPGGGLVRLLAARVVPDGSKPSVELTTADGFTVEFDFRAIEGGMRFHLTIHLYNAEELLVFESYSGLDTKWAGKPLQPGLYRTACRIPGGLLNDGRYSVAALLVRDGSNVLDVASHAVGFELHDAIEGRSTWYGKWGGVVRPQLHWSTEKVAP